jgi:hypothetical protein
MSLFIEALEWVFALMVVIPEAILLLCGFLLEFARAPLRTIRAMRRAPWRQNWASVIDAFSVDLSYLEEEKRAK